MHPSRLQDDVQLEFNVAMLCFRKNLNGCTIKFIFFLSLSIYIYLVYMESVVKFVLLLTSVSCVGQVRLFIVCWTDCLSRYDNYDISHCLS